MADFDSTETLEEIRKLLGVIKHGVSVGSEWGWYDSIYELCNKVAQLDAELINGGAYPKQWT